MGLSSKCVALGARAPSARGKLKKRGIPRRHFSSGAHSIVGYLMLILGFGMMGALAWGKYRLDEGEGHGPIV